MARRRMMNPTRTPVVGATGAAGLHCPANLLAFLRDAARYDVLTKWWADVVKPTHTRLYIGIAFYKVGEPSRNEPDWTIQGGVPELKNSSISTTPCRT